LIYNYNNLLVGSYEKVNIIIISYGVYIVSK